MLAQVFHQIDAFNAATKAMDWKRNRSGQLHLQRNDELRNDRCTKLFTFRMFSLEKWSHDRS